MPSFLPAWVLWLAAAIVLILTYEALRAWVLGRLRRRFSRSIDRSIRRKGVRLDPFKFAQRFLIREEILNDVEVNAAILDKARETGRRVDEVREEVEDYIEEIVPAFSLVSYYRLGATVARVFMNWLYSVVVDESRIKDRPAVTEDACVVYIANHRSNVDYVAIAYTLIDEISLSYATGEWARVWPLESLFKSFGAYFVRRGFRDQVYHLVLEKYVQLITRNGVTQGIFLEGGLTRDGKCREPKVGILDYLVKMKADPGMTRDLVIIPVGINYDRVLEDEVLLAEKKTGREKSGFRANLKSLVRVVAGAPWILTVNIVRRLRGYRRLHGYAAVRFGTPISVSAWMSTLDCDLFTLPREQRRLRIHEFADSLMEGIRRTIPVTPVPLVSYILLGVGEASPTRTTLLQELVKTRRRLVRAGAPLVMGDEFESSRLGREHLEEERESRLQDLVAFEETFLDVEEARETLQIALGILGRRKIISESNGAIQVEPSGKELLAYYANSIAHYLDGPEPSEARVAG
ncbi:MAG: 1-acyl-sn-glycerol-3-phosphate acyltransferase [Deltaproteobacteria bacterium]|nr:1-acyl-sn-glycerol-3-phosphate acyltransferase [Deltaproteobacteria bacterium]